VTDDPADAGLALLLADGVAEAMSAAESTLATVQSGASRALAGLTQFQTVGTAASAVPPLQPPSQAAPEASNEPEEQARPAARSVPAPLVPQTGAQQVAFAPVSVRDLGAEPDVQGPVAPSLAPVSFAVFAPPPAPAAMPDKPPGQPISADSAPTVLRDGGQVWAPDATASAVPMASAGGDQAASRSHAPPGSQGTQSGPTGGDVFLDGTRVGTWLADHMAREAGRPQMGSTGFDPRLTPAWPGTLQGG
jgi:hypothetical protein